MEKNLTTGSVFGNLICFSLPYLLSYFLQTLYGMADLFIIGQFGSVADITSVSIGSQVMHMFTVMIVGLAMGATVTIGHNIGAGKTDNAAKAVGNTAVLFMILSFMLTALLLALTKPIVNIMSTPSEATEGTVKYLSICFMGIPFITAYNIISSVFRGIGDSKTPMYFIAVSCALNIILDCIFMGIFNLGPAGAALGTTISQTISVIIAFVSMKKYNIGISLHKSHFKPDFSLLKQILKIGVPISLQDCFVQIAFIIITVIANKRGLNDAAAVGIVEKIIGILFLVPSSMLSSVSALSAQNIGAKKFRRARFTLLYAILICIGFGLTASILVQFFSDSIIGVFKNDPAVIRLGSQYLKGYVWDCLFAGIHFCFSGYFCALGKSGISFMHNMLSIVLVRIPGAYTASKMYKNTLFPMGLAAPLGSLLSAIICIIAYVIILKKED